MDTSISWKRASELILEKSLTYKIYYMKKLVWLCFGFVAQLYRLIVGAGNEKGTLFSHNLNNQTFIIFYILKSHINQQSVAFPL